MKYRTQDDLTALFGEKEAVQLEFKSSRPLANPDDRKARDNFIHGVIVKTVSAFLNSAGGNIIIGIEEKNDVAYELSQGVPDRVRYTDIKNMIVGMIQPSVADLVSVNSIKLDAKSEEGERLNAFCVTVRSGNTAYQSAKDKIYYARRDGQSVPMDDKDVRVRMLVGDKPRIDVKVVPVLLPPVQSPVGSAVSSVRWDIEIRNVGIKTIKRAFIRYKLVSEGLGSSGRQISDTSAEAYVRDLQCGDDGQIGLMPGMNISVQGFDISSLMFADPVGEIALHAEVQIFIDDGLPFQE